MGLKLNSLLLRSVRSLQSLRLKKKRASVSQVLSSGRRKYTEILEKLVAHSICRVSCNLADSRTIIEGVKKEKVAWKKRKRWPEGQALKIDIVDEENNKGITFRRVLDTSVNNL